MNETGRHRENCRSRRGAARQPVRIVSIPPRSDAAKRNTHAGREEPPSVEVFAGGGESQPGGRGQGSAVCWTGVALVWAGVGLGRCRFEVVRRAIWVTWLLFTPLVRPRRRGDRG